MAGVSEGGGSGSGMVGSTRPSSSSMPVEAGEGTNRATST